jgi:hypothetical protein
VNRTGVTSAAPMLDVMLAEVEVVVRRPDFDFILWGSGRPDQQVCYSHQIDEDTNLIAEHDLGD